MMNMDQHIQNADWIKKVAYLRTAGGEGSGNFGHAGRPGERGGSAPSNESSPNVVEAEIKKLRRSMLDEALDLAEVPVGSNDETEKIADVTNEERSAVKAHVVNSLTERLLDEVESSEDEEEAGVILEGVRNQVQQRVDRWAVTSGDHNTEAIEMQVAVAKEFDLKDAALEHMAPSTVRDRMEHGAVTEAFNRQFVRVEYELTQEWFKARGMTHVSLVRGMKSGIPEPNENGEVDITMQPASSWTVDRETADTFAAAMSPWQSGQGGVLSVRVPVSRVLSTAVTGRGALHEGEVILLGGKYRVGVVPRP